MTSQPQAGSPVHQIDEDESATIRIRRRALAIRQHLANRTSK